ncbi:hypothetical protein CLV62_101211 [Dysgonomonas alginatilytica]|uniref:Uncharacterized protein n=1 Tax=Dysgonomonas alginatilytica TaxID=1605892 RepID=A0A2V3Q0U8_9BACT|nr:hypothetical protein [Dysgonomonas alginatilytica]PXV68945.1 hypothetical protein CLV62_101211 [Dysgonomonas alginatilytica]
MNKSLIYNIIGIGILFLFMQSCVDKEYDSDKLNTNIELNVPPVPLGGFDTIYVNFLPSIPPEIVIGARVALSDTIRGLFDQNTIDRFFFEGSSGVVISAKLDAMVMPQESGLEIEVLLDIIDADKTKNEFVKIPSQRIVSAKNQNFEVRIGPEYMKYMKNARDLHFIFGIRVAAINFTRQDYIYLRRVILFAGGIQLEL